MEFLLHKSFQTSLLALHRKGGPFRTAADQVHAMVSKAQSGMSESEVFAKAVTHHGESRIAHCLKYDLAGRARLITVRHDNAVIFLFVGDHDAADQFLDAHRGLKFVVARGETTPAIQTVHVSDPSQGGAGLIRTQQDLSAKPMLLEMLPERYRETVVAELSDESRISVMEIGPLSTDNDIQAVGDRVAANVGDKQACCIMDVLMMLRGGNVQEAKNRVDLFKGELMPAETLTKTDAAHVVSGDEVVKVSDVDPALFAHFAKTAAYRDWMMYLHPDQRIVVDKDFPGSARVSGVSGSGKTCVLIHRALRLASKYQGEPILVLTLNPALARLIGELLKGARGDACPRNLKVKSFWDWCRELLLEFDPENKASYTRTTLTPNPYAIAEHIDEIWDEYYFAENNFAAYDDHLLNEVHRYLLARGVYPHDYLKQEFDYIRSARYPGTRHEYLSMERTGRAVPLQESQRGQVLKGLTAWEEKMAAVGALDEVGIATALKRFEDRTAGRYRCILVDEVQDFGTLELSLIRRAVRQGENDLFLCGDAAQSVYTKHHDLSSAGIELSSRELKLRKSYRNSREILTAAHGVLSANFDQDSRALAGLEIIEPELANFSSTPPAILRATSVQREIAHALTHLDWKASAEQAGGRKRCIAICGFSQTAIERMGKQLGLPVLSGDVDVIGERVFLSDLEHAKGFEFDSMVIVNCSGQTIPHPELPREEAFRELSRLYVAMTRAKHELILSYSGTPSRFLDVESNDFVTGGWAEYAEAADLKGFELPPPSLAARDDKRNWNVSAQTFLKKRDAVGLSAALQEKLLEHVRGHNRTLDGRQIAWATVSDFLRAMQNPRSRNKILSNVAWEELSAKLSLVRLADNARTA